MFYADVHRGWPESGGERLRLGTLVLLRWMAITGQIAALLAAPIFDLALPLGLCSVAVGASVVANLTFMFVYPASMRLSEVGAARMLIFDLCQLVFLLAVTGGLANPFALLVLAPVTIAATALELRAVLLVVASALVLVTIAGWFHLPLRLTDGRELEVPELLRFGFWLSLVIGIVFLAVYSRRVASETRAMSDALFAAQMALAREQKLTDLAGVVAAAAHELGTPLATIKLVSGEMQEALAGQPELQEDARLIRTQAERCRDILAGMGRAGKDDLQLRQAPLTALVREAAEPHLGRGKAVSFADLGTERPPVVQRRPEVIHGLRNLVQNAVDFARSRVWVDTDWTGAAVTVRIVDDGPGFPAQLIPRIGDPFVRPRREAGAEYEGMGLGLFIAKTLLERTGAELSFANAADPFLAPEERPERCGAVVEVTWPLALLLAPPVRGENPPNLP